MNEESKDDLIGDVTRDVELSSSKQKFFAKKIHLESADISMEGVSSVETEQIKLSAH